MRSSSLRLDFVEWKRENLSRIFLRSVGVVERVEFPFSFQLKRSNIVSKIINDVFINIERRVFTKINFERHVKRISDGPARFLPHLRPNLGDKIRKVETKRDASECSVKDARRRLGCHRLGQDGKVSLWKGFPRLLTKINIRSLLRWHNSACRFLRAHISMVKRELFYRIGWKM